MPVYLEKIFSFDFSSLKKFISHKSLMQIKSQSLSNVPGLSNLTTPDELSIILAILFRLKCSNNTIG